MVWLVLGVLVGLVVVTLLRDVFRPFGFLMDVLLIVIVAAGVLYVWVLRRRPGGGPMSENVEDALAAARVKLEQGEMSEEEYARARRNVKD